MAQISSMTVPQTLERLDGCGGTARIRSLAPLPLDEPRDLGGEGSAPCPMDYLLPAFGGCLLSSLSPGLLKKKVGSSPLSTCWARSRPDFTWRPDKG